MKYNILKYKSIFMALFMASFMASFMALMFNSISPAMAYEFSGNILKFQLKLAKKGDPSAQYKLGLMYESGFGVEVDFDEALFWYEKSSKQNNKAAARRINYVDILRNGYKPSEDAKWFKQLKQDADVNDGEAALLLGVMYKNGTVVKKNLRLSHKYLKKAVVKDISGAEDELVYVRVMMDSQKEKEQAKQEKKEVLNEQRVAEEKRLREEEKSRNRADAKQRKIKKQRRQQQRLAREEKEREKSRMRMLALKQKNEAVAQKKIENTIVNEAPEVVVNESNGMSWAEAVEQERKKKEAEN